MPAYYTIARTIRELQLPTGVPNLSVNYTIPRTTREPQLRYPFRSAGNDYTIPRTTRELQHAFSILFIFLDYTIPGAIREALLKVNRIFKYFKYILSQYKLPHCLQMAAAPGHKKIRLESLSAVRGGYFISSRRREVYEKKQKQVPAVSSAGQAQEFSGHYVSAAKVYVGIL